MKSLQKVILVLFVMLSTYSCEKEESLMVKVRIQNSTGEDMSNVVVDINDLKQSYNDLKGGEISESKMFAESYLVNSIEFKINEQNFEIIPVNSLAIWAAPINGASYTYNVFPNTDKQSFDTDLDYLFSIDTQD